MSKKPLYIRMKLSYLSNLIASYEPTIRRYIENFKGIPIIVDENLKENYKFIYMPEDNMSKKEKVLYVSKETYKKWVTEGFIDKKSLIRFGFSAGTRVAVEKIVCSVPPFQNSLLKPLSKLFPHLKLKYSNPNDVGEVKLLIDGKVSGITGKDWGLDQFEKWKTLKKVVRGIREEINTFLNKENK